MQDGKQGGITPFQAKGGNHTNLLHVAAINEEQKNWPTANARDWKDSITGTHPPSRPRMSEQTLGQAVSVVHGQAAPASSSSLGSRQGLWATPTNCEHKGATTPEACKQWESRGQNLPEQTASIAAGRLNPRWVETLMGLPVGWTMPSCASPVTIALTSYDSSATESCQQQQNELFEC
jgi:hypothetical protein